MRVLKLITIIGISLQANYSQGSSFAGVAVLEDHVNEVASEAASKISKSENHPSAVIEVIRNTQAGWYAGLVHVDDFIREFDVSNPNFFGSGGMALREIQVLRPETYRKRRLWVSSWLNALLVKRADQEKALKSLVKMVGMSADQLRRMFQWKRWRVEELRTLIGQEQDEIQIMAYQRELMVLRMIRQISLSSGYAGAAVD